MRRGMLLAVCALLIVGALWWRLMVPRNRKVAATNHFHRSEQFAHQGRWNEAEHELLLALENDPRYFEARDGLAALYAANGRLSDAIQTYEAGIRTTPDDAQLRYKLAHLFYENRRYVEAIQAMQEGLRLAPNDRHYAYMLGMSYERAGQWEQARAHWKEAARLHPHDPIIRRGLHRVERRLEATSRAKPRRTE